MAGGRAILPSTADLLLSRYQYKAGYLTVSGLEWPQAFKFLFCSMGYPDKERSAALYDWSPDRSTVRSYREDARHRAAQRLHDREAEHLAAGQRLQQRDAR